MYLGHRASRWVYLGLAVIGYFAVVAGVVAQVLPTWSLVCGVSLPAVWHRAQVFIAHPDKAQTFHLAIQNLVLANGSLLAGLVIAAGVSA
jgi:1,4-dihydroxy-2-naphthoate octaprenyltransferase